MAIRLQRCLGPVAHLDPGQYTVETVSGRPAIRCPGCREISELEPPHAVQRGGFVAFVWKCPTDGCPVMECLQLDDHDEPVVTT